MTALEYDDFGVLMQRIPWTDFMLATKLTTMDIFKELTNREDPEAKAWYDNVNILNQRAYNPVRSEARVHDFYVILDVEEPSELNSFRNCWGIGVDLYDRKREDRPRIQLYIS